VAAQPAAPRRPRRFAVRSFSSSLLLFAAQTP